MGFPQTPTCQGITSIGLPRRLQWDSTLPWETRRHTKAIGSNARFQRDPTSMWPWRPGLLGTCLTWRNGLPRMRLCMKGWTKPVPPLLGKCYFLKHRFFTCRYPIQTMTWYSWIRCILHNQGKIRKKRLHSFEEVGCTPRLWKCKEWLGGYTHRMAAQCLEFLRR